MTKNEINTMRALLRKMVSEIEAMEEWEVLNTFVEMWDLEEIQRAVNITIDSIIDYMPAKRG